MHSVILVVSFDGVGRLNESDKLEMNVMKLTVGKDVYELMIIFSESAETLKMEGSSEPKERLASLVIKSGGKELVNERKQFLRFGEGSFESLVIASLVEKRNALAFCIDGAYF